MALNEDCSEDEEDYKIVEGYLKNTQGETKEIKKNKNYRESEVSKKMK